MSILDKADYLRKVRVRLPGKTNWEIIFERLGYSKKSQPKQIIFRQTDDTYVQADLDYAPNTRQLKAIKSFYLKDMREAAPQDYSGEVFLS